MKSKSSLTISLLFVAVLLVGCSAEPRQANSNQGDSSSRPKLYKPKTFPVAIQRLKQIHESLMAEGEFPAPVTIEYVEVLHGQGASAHSHFYLAADFEANENGEGHDGHAGRHKEDDERVKHHSMEVGLRTELVDIITWLPKIAAKSNLNESNWNSVNSISSRLAKIIDEVGVDVSDDSFRESWKSKSDEIQPMLNELQTINDSSGVVQ